MAPSTSTTATTDSRTSREAFLDAAEEMLALRGYAAMSISGVCKAAGLPVGSLYRHFKNKAELATALLSRGTERFFAELPDPGELGETPRERLVRYYEAAAGVFARDPRFLRLTLLLALQESDDLDLRPEISRARGTVVKNIARVIEPVARQHGAADAAALAVELADLTVDLTSGAVFTEAAQRMDFARSMRRTARIVMLVLDDDVSLVGSVEEHARAGLTAGPKG